MVVFNIFMAIILVIGLFAMTMSLCGGARDRTLDDVFWAKIPSRLKYGWRPWRRWAAASLYSSDRCLAVTYWPFKFMAKWWYKSWGLNVSFYQRQLYGYWCFRDGYEPPLTSPGSMASGGALPVGAIYFSPVGTPQVLTQHGWMPLGYVDETPKKRMKTW